MKRALATEPARNYQLLTRRAIVRPAAKARGGAPPWAKRLQEPEHGAILISWHGEPAQRDAAMKRFLQTGGQPPAGVTLLGRWHAIGTVKGVAVAECDDPALIGKWALEWNDLFEMDVSAALDDAQMGPLLAAQAAR